MCPNYSTVFLGTEDCRLDFSTA